MRGNRSTGPEKDLGQPKDLRKLTIQAIAAGDAALLQKIQAFNGYIDSIRVLHAVEGESTAYDHQGKVAPYRISRDLWGKDWEVWPIVDRFFVLPSKEFQQFLDRAQTGGFAVDLNLLYSDLFDLVLVKHPAGTDLTALLPMERSNEKRD